MKEALEALESEREQKYELKKKLDEKISNESVLNMSSFGLRFSGLTGFGSKKSILSSSSRCSSSSTRTFSADSYSSSRNPCPKTSSSSRNPCPKTSSSTASSYRSILRSLSSSVRNINPKQLASSSSSQSGKQTVSQSSLNSCKTRAKANSTAIHASCPSVDAVLVLSPASTSSSSTTSYVSVKSKPPLPSSSLSSSCSSRTSLNPVAAASNKIPNSASLHFNNKSDDNDSQGQTVVINNRLERKNAYNELLLQTGSNSHPRVGRVRPTSLIEPRITEESPDISKITKSSFSCKSLEVSSDLNSVSPSSPPCLVITSSEEKNSGSSKNNNNHYQRRSVKYSTPSPNLRTSSQNNTDDEEGRDGNKSVLCSLESSSSLSSYIFSLEDSRQNSLESSSSQNLSSCLSSPSSLVTPRPTEKSCSPNTYSSSIFLFPSLPPRYVHHHHSQSKSFEQESYFKKKQLPSSSVLYSVNSSTRSLPPLQSSSSSQKRYKRHRQFTNLIHATCRLSRTRKPLSFSSSSQNKSLLFWSKDKDVNFKSSISQSHNRCTKKSLSQSNRRFFGKRLTFYSKASGVRLTSRRKDVTSCSVSSSFPPPNFAEKSNSLSLCLSPLKTTKTVSSPSVIFNENERLIESTETLILSNPSAVTKELFVRASDSSHVKVDTDGREGRKDSHDDEEEDCVRSHTELVIDASSLPLLSGREGRKERSKNRQEIVLITSPPPALSSPVSFASWRSKRSLQNYSPLLLDQQHLDFDRIDTVDWKEPVLTKVRPLHSPSFLEVSELPSQVHVDDARPATMTQVDSFCKTRRNTSLHAAHSVNPCVSCLKITLKGMITCCLGIFAP